jgi:hypothetical protein
VRPRAGVGPYLGSDTGARISRIGRNGQRTTVVDNLPSSTGAPAFGSPISGADGIAFVGNTLYAVLAGAGCSHGVPDVPNGVLRVNRNASATMIADPSAFQQANPVANPEADDFEPDGTWYSMVAYEGALYAVESNDGELDRITRDGQISRVVDISASQGHVVPTALVEHHGDCYVGTLMPFPAAPVAKVYKISRRGDIRVVAKGLTTVAGLAFEDDQLYVLEMSAPVTDPGPPVVPGTGRVVRVTRSGTLEPVVTRLMLPQPSPLETITICIFRTLAGASRLAADKSSAPNCRPEDGVAGTKIDMSVEPTDTDRSGPGPVGLSLDLNQLLRGVIPPDERQKNERKTSYE